MSALDLLTLRPPAEPTAPDLRSIRTDPRSEDAGRSFRDELSEAGSPQTEAEKSERSESIPVDESRRSDSEASDVSADEPVTNGDDTEGSEAAEVSDTADKNSESDAVPNVNENEEAAVATDPAPVVALGNANTLPEDTLAASAQADTSTAEDSTSLYTNTANEIFPGINVLNVNQPGSTQSEIGNVLNAADVAVPTGTLANQTNTGVTTYALLSATEIAASPILADPDANAEQNNSGNTPNGNAANNAAVSTDANRNALGSGTIPLPGAVTDPGLAGSAPALSASSNVNAIGSETAARVNLASPTPNTSGNDALNAARLTRGLNNAVNQQGGSVTLRLTPPELGTVRIQLNLQGTNVSARFHAETDAAQRLLSQQLGQLRTSLESQGLNVERLGVQSLNASSNSSGLQQQNSNDPSQSQSQANADGRSRGQSGQSSQQNSQDRDSNTPTEFTQLLDPPPGDDLDPVADTLSRDS
ncbi:MAG: flagellar hook-length control protein FliK [Planctomycetota bacterium]